MEDGKLIAIVIGIVGALIGVYFREGIKKAQARLAAAVTIESTLHHWLGIAMESKALREILITGYTYSKEEKEAFLSKDIDKIDQLHKKLNDICEGTKEKFLKEQEANIEKILVDIKSLSKEEYTEILKEIDNYRNEIETGRIFLDQKKLSVLDWHEIPSILEVRSELQSILIGFKFALIHIYTNDKTDKDKVYILMISVLKSALKVSKNFLPLMNYSKRIRKKGILGNMLS